MVDSGLITDVELEETLLDVVDQGLRDVGVSELLLCPWNNTDESSGPPSHQSLQAQSCRCGNV